MIIQELNSFGVLEIETRGHADHRGSFIEVFNQPQFAEFTGLDIKWVQDCRFFSYKGALRGPHFYPAFLGQYKLIECLIGTIFDVAICVDPHSPFYGDYVSVTLQGGDHRKVLVPPGYAHAVLALEDSVATYKTNVGNRADVQTALRWDDPDVGVEWPIEPTLLSQEPLKFLREAKYRV